MSEHRLPLVVVGAGAAGIAAAIEARRCGAEVVLLDEHGVAGGTIRIAHEVRNVPFLPDRAPGQLVADALRELLCRWSIGVIPGRCVRIASKREDLVVVRSDGVRVMACGAVIATGARAMLPELTGLARGSDPPWAQSAPDAFASGPIASAAVVGGSDVAFDQARWLRARGAAVTVLCRGAVPKAPAWLVHAAHEEGVALWCSTRVVAAQWIPPHAVLQLDRSGQKGELRAERIVPAIGRAPAWRAEIAIDEEAMPRVRIAGDARGRRARYVSAALGDGCVAAAELLADSRERSG